MPEYLPIDSLARPGFNDEYYSGVLEEVVPVLIQRGVLQGKTVRGKPMVLDDDAYRRILQLGIEPLTYGQQGWSLVAVLAPIDDVLEVARDVFDVVESRQAVTVHPVGMGSGDNPPQDVRPLYLVKPRASDWTLLVIRVHWFTLADAEMAESFATAASKRLKTRAVAAFDDDVGGSFAQEFENGKSVAEWSTNDDGFHLGFYERGIAGPSAWPSVVDGRHALMSHNPQAIERADFLGITEPPKKVPRGWKKVTTTENQKVTGEDLLSMLASALGAPVSTATKKRGQATTRKLVPKKRPKPAAKKAKKPKRK
jgi:hypothetical protein